MVTAPNSNPTGFYATHSYLAGLDLNSSAKSLPTISPCNFRRVTLKKARKMGRTGNSKCKPAAHFRRGRACPHPGTQRGCRRGEWRPQTQWWACAPSDVLGRGSNLFGGGGKKSKSLENSFRSYLKMYTFLQEKTEKAFRLRWWFFSLRNYILMYFVGVWDFEKMLNSKS